MINDCEYNLAEKRDVNDEKEDSDDYSIVSIECESVSTCSNNGNESEDEDNVSELNLEKSDSDGFIENNDHLNKCPDDETVLLSNEGISFAPGENNTPKSIFMILLLNPLHLLKFMLVLFVKFPSI